MLSSIDALKENKVHTQDTAYNKIVSRKPEERDLEKLLREAQPSYKSQLAPVPVSKVEAPTVSKDKIFPTAAVLPGFDKGGADSDAQVITDVHFSQAGVAKKASFLVVPGTVVNL